VYNAVLVNGQILASNDGSYVNQYDAVGNAVMRITDSVLDDNLQPLLQFYRSNYNLRGQFVRAWQVQTLGESVSTDLAVTSSFDANGRLTETRRYFETGTILDYHTDDAGDQTRDVSGYLSEVDTYTYDADGRVLTEIRMSRGTRPQGRSAGG